LWIWNLKIFFNINLTYIHCKLLAVYLFTDPTRANSFHFASHGKSFLFKIYFTHVSLKIKYHTDNIMWRRYLIKNCVFEFEIFLNNNF